MKIPTLVDDASNFLIAVQNALNQNIVEEVNTDQLQNHFEKLNKEIHLFEQQALLHYGDSELVHHGSYLLCTFADEKLIEHIGFAWKPYSLLLKQHNDSHGGEVAWETLQTLLNTPSKLRNPGNADLLSLYELVIRQGFQGRYQLLLNGDEELEKIRTRLHEFLHGSESFDYYIRELVDIAYAKQNNILKKIIIAIAISALLILIFLLIYVDVYLDHRWNQLISHFQFL